LILRNIFDDLVHKKNVVKHIYWGVPRACPRPLASQAASPMLRMEGAGRVLRGFQCLLPSLRLSAAHRAASPRAPTPAYADYPRHKKYVPSFYLLLTTISFFLLIFVSTLNPNFCFTQYNCYDKKRTQRTVQTK
jgi:hypothetical protein